MFHESRWLEIRQQLQADAPQRAVEILAVSKGQPVADIRAAWRAGQRRFGESYLQEALEKMADLSDCGIEWHFVGRLQSNKTAPIAQSFDWVHGLADDKIARRLSQARLSTGKGPLDVCLQVNLSDEPGKGGVSRERLPDLANQVRDCPGLRLRGLMTLPESSAIGATEQRIRWRFAELREMMASLNQAGFDLDTLSMGMSADYSLAVAEGATLVRLGTTLFGQREVKG